MPKSVIPNKPKEEWTKDEELAALRAENLYLKKLWTLIQKENEQIKVNEKENSEPVEN
jgi:transposase